eukprot:7742433-Alexandrium_andersonii.AAC.1
MTFAWFCKCGVSNWNTRSTCRACGKGSRPDWKDQGRQGDRRSPPKGKHDGSKQSTLWNAFGDP